MTLIYDNRRVLQSLDLRTLIESVQDLFIETADGRTVQPSRYAVDVPGGSPSLIVPMFAVSSSSGIACFKVLLDNPENLERGRSRQRSTILAIDSETGECLGVFEGGAITQLRTAATSAVATRALAREDSQILGLIGAGAQARSHLHAISAVRDIRQVVVWNRTPARIERLALEAHDLGILCTVVSTPRSVVEQSDIVCTLTPSPDPIVEGAWLRPGQHLNAVGAPPRPDHREIDAETFRRARTVVDSSEVALSESGAVRAAIAEGAITPDSVQLELGDVLRGSFCRSDDDITLFNSVGLPLQDLAAVTLLLGRQNRAGESYVTGAEASRLMTRAARV